MKTRVLHLVGLLTILAASSFGAKEAPQLWAPDLTKPWMPTNAFATCRPKVKPVVECVPGFLFVEAENFADYGGWRLDTQFVHRMGSAYLIASGAGTPVPSAQTSVDVPRTGTWRVWARTKDWVPEHSPGLLSLAINGKEGALLGASKRDGWHWEKAGDFELAAGEARLSLVDKSGYFGRCDAVLLTTDLAYLPPDDAAALECERRRLKGEPTAVTDRGSFDVMVVGAGPAGCAAAIAAARHGARTALIGDRPVLGGNASDEIGVNMCGAAYDKPFARETGIAEETTCLRARFTTPALSEPLRRLTEAETNLTVFFCERVVRAEMSEGRIAAVVSVNTMTGARSHFSARQFVDATGDGWLGYFAGAKCRQGREGQAEFGEKLAPEKGDDMTMSGLLQEPKVGVAYWGEDTGHPVDYETPAFARILPEGFRRSTPHAFGMWWLEHPGWIDDCADPERARDELIRIAFAYWGWIKNVSEHRKDARNFRLREVPIMAGRRESRRLVGDYILNSNDLLAGRVFPDAVAYGGWPLDTHDLRGITAVESNGHRYPCERIPIYTIPFRSLYSVNIPNLMMAGRDISATHIALGSTRVQLTCMNIGQAVGTAAAMCVAEGLTPRELGRHQISVLQQQLMKDDAYIPGFRNEDPDDLARTASVTASSSEAETRRYTREGPVALRHVSPTNVVDGVTRPVGDESHAWVSAASLPQWIRLDLAVPAKVDEVRLTFDTDLEFNAWRNRTSEELVRDYTLEGSADGSNWHVLADVTDNFMRQRAHRFAPELLSSVRLTVRRTYGSPEANVFEIRVNRARAVLPGEVAGPEALPPDPFPDRMSAFVWRNWFCVPVARMAKVVGAREEDLGGLAEQMGLPPQPAVSSDWRRKGYITVVRRNWHLLPYDQLTDLLEMTREEFARCLTEDDFLFGKLGSLKPRCGRLVWDDDALTCGAERRSVIARILNEERCDAFDEEPRFSFVKDIAAASQPQATNPTSDSPFGIRMISSYFADYGDPLSDPETGSFPEGLLQKLSAQGINAVWMHVVLNTLVRDPEYPEFGEGSEARIANLKKLVARARRYGIRVYLYLNEPRALPASFYDVSSRSAIRGVRDSHYGTCALCTSTPEVRRWLYDSLKKLFSDVQGLGGILTITMSENLTNCASLGNKDDCPRCRNRSVAEILAEVNGVMAEGVREGDPNAQAIIWNWAWPQEAETEILARLPKRNCQAMAVSEKDIVVERGGASIPVSDYSISVVGPGESARRFWHQARVEGLPAVAKVQAACSWELASFPYLPVMDLVAAHAVNLSRQGVGGVMLSWSCGSAPSPNLSVYGEIRKGEEDGALALNRIAERLYGEAAAPSVRKAWTAYSDGFRDYPFDVVVAYKGPQQMGPSNPLYLKPTGYQATMVGIPYDGLTFGTWDNMWIGRYPVEGWISQFEKVAAGFAKGNALFAEATGRMPAEKQPDACRELAMFRAQEMHFASCVDQARFILARDAGDRAGMVRSAKRELDRAKAYLPLIRADSRIGYECSNHYFAIPQDLREKIVGCRLILDELNKCGKRQ